MKQGKDNKLVIEIKKKFMCINPRLVKQSDNLDFIFNSSDIFKSLTIIYERI